MVDWLPTLAGICGVECSGGRTLDGRDALSVLRGEGGDVLARFWQLNQFQPVGWLNAAMREGSWKLVRPQLAQKPKTDEDKRRMERYVEMDIKYKYQPDEVVDLMDDPDPEVEIPPPAELELYNIDDDPLEKNNLASAEPDRASRMLGQLETWFEEIEVERQRIQPDGSILELADG